MEHSMRAKREYRRDKYGQIVRLKCKCGITTGWHCEIWKAEESLYQLHVDAKR